MIVGRLKCVFSDKPPWRENDEVKGGLTRIVCLDRQDCEDGRIWVIVGDRTHSVKLVQVILERSIVAVPCHDVEWAAILSAFKCVTHVAIDNRPLICSLLVSSDRNAEVSLVC